MLLITVRLPSDATLAQAMRHLGLPEEDVDTGYGLVLIDPDQNLYGLRVTEAAARRVDPAAGGGPYADPRIEPYGPPA
ncbi:hypothetical protein OG884_00260 [Streptosporangium sp. NBC_01755]|uniref:hypothetical protein n=1 Tax=unclassified Streptosporangium TaxID=2632669 RepID=UPI002DDAC66E|nr:MULTISPECIES: hypothetical protein [unclassified Streptosporangium]WSA28112.1 hypothetical protein OIE13_09710 [Streptosporangium sp. NBC_01810]WSD00416.1 hypothetical protein OG884_00260 [Streptosporangium sp. NBC_01755]